MKSSYIFHINTNYAEISKSELPQVEKTSYLPFLNLLQNNDVGTVLLNITGLSLEYFKDNNPSILKLIKELLASNKIRVTGCTYSHPILPLLPSEDIRKQILLHKELVEEYLETKPIGFFPPELAVDPVLPNYLLELGYKWMFVDGEAMIYSAPFPKSG